MDRIDTKSGLLSRSMLRSLYGTDNVGLSIPRIDDEGNEGWLSYINSLPEYLREYYNRLKPVAITQPVYSSSGSNSNNHASPESFSYDTDRYNPFNLSANLSRSLKLLQECYELHRRIHDLMIMEAEQQAKFDMEKDMAAFDETEDNALLRTLSSMGAAKMTKSVSADERAREPAPFMSNEEYKAEGGEVWLSQEIRKLQRAELKRIEDASKVEQGPYNYKDRRQRAQLIQIERRNDLSQLREVTAHGLYLLYGINPKKHRPDIKYTFEDATRVTLRAITQHLERLRRYDEAFVHHLSLKEDRRYNNGQYDQYILNKTYFSNKDTRDLINEKNLSFRLTRNDVLDSNRRFPRLLGISIELFTYEKDDLGKVWKLKITPPAQPANRSGSPDVATISLKPVYTSVALSHINTSPTHPIFVRFEEPAFVGNQTLVNIDPFADDDWKIDFLHRRSDGVELEERPVADVRLRMHIATLPQDTP